MKKPLEGLGYRVTSTVKVLKLFKKGDVLQNQIAVEQVKIAGEKLEKIFRLRKETKIRFKSDKL